MDHLAGKPYWRLSFDAGGVPADTVADQFVTEAAQAGLSDLFVFSHGWGASASSADELYNDMFPRLGAAANTAALTSIGYVGIFWPSIWFPDPAPAKLTFLRADVAASHPGGIDALLSGAEIATTLAECYPDPAPTAALTEMGALIDQGLSSAGGGGTLDAAQRGKVERFHVLLQSLVTTAVGAAEDNGEAALIKSTTPAVAYDRIAQLMGSNPAGAELGLGR